MGRIGAFLIHLGISLAIFAVLAYLVVFVWYPDFFFATDGGWQGIRIIVFVDLVLGPLLTLIVFNRNKPTKELRRDLSIIALIQITCLTAGVYVVYSERPIALVYVDGKFYSMSVDDYLDAGVKVPDLSEYPGPSPKRIMVNLPDDLEAQSAVRAKALRNRIPLRAMTDHYVGLDTTDIARGSDSLTRSQLVERDESTGDLTQWLSSRDGSLSDYAFFPFGARYGIRILGIDKRSGEIDGLLDTDVAVATSRKGRDGST